MVEPAVSVEGIEISTALLSLFIPTDASPSVPERTFSFPLVRITFPFVSTVTPAGPSTASYVLPATSLMTSPRERVAEVTASGAPVITMVVASESALAALNASAKIV